MSVPSWILPCRLDSPRNASSRNRWCRLLDTQLCKSNFHLYKTCKFSHRWLSSWILSSKGSSQCSFTSQCESKKSSVSPLACFAPNTFARMSPSFLVVLISFTIPHMGSFSLWSFAASVASAECSRCNLLLIASFAYAIHSNRRPAEFLESIRVDFDRWLNWPFESAPRETRWNSTQL